MSPEIQFVDLGFDRCYFVRSGEALVVVDGGAPRKGAVFRRALDRFGVRPGELRLILLTHAHWDHVGSAGEMRAITGAPIALHEAEVPWLESGRAVVPPGVTPWGRFLMRINRPLLRFFRVPPTAVDLPIGDDGLSLAEFGIPGRVHHTPGHSPGSVTLLLESGDAFVGDQAMNRLPLRRTPGLPIFADDLEQVKASWRRLLAHRVNTIHPAHGDAFPAAVMRAAVAA